MNFSKSYEFLLSLQNQRGTSEEPESAAARFTRLGHFLAVCDNPHLKIAHYIHVTGTSGKGSTATMIAAICAAAGLRTGLLTSPHISQITERWRINGVPMSRRDFCTLIEQLKTTYDRFLTNYPSEWVTYHEVLTLIGFIYFAQKNVTYAVLEVGMGGDLDATNIIPRKEAAIITTVGADHLELLGPTLSDVARHKAGIITVPTTVITGVSDPEHRAIITEQAKKTDSVCPDISLKYTVLKKTAETTAFIYQNTKYSLHVFGEHQIKNAILAIRTAECLALPPRAIKQGLRLARFPLRFECLKRAPWCIADGAHNPEKFAATVDALTDLKRILREYTGREPRIHIVVGFSRNKDLANALTALTASLPTTIAATRCLSNPFRAAASPGVIADICRPLAPEAEIRPFILSTDALDFALSRATPDDIILITGSIFLGGELRLYLRKNLRK